MEQIIFTDLDGTLLNHDDYSFEEATEALQYIKKKSIPLIIATSKTFSEVRALRKKLDIYFPFIVENGGGIFIPTDSIVTSQVASQEKYITISKSKSYLEVRIFFEHIKQYYPVKGFGDMSVEEVMERTGLSKENAIYSKQRDFTEPFIFEGEVDLRFLQKEANKKELEIVKGGRFYHVVSLREDKAKAMKYVTHLYEEYFDKKIKVIALGESENDLSMLKAADVGVLIPMQSGVRSSLDTANIIKADFCGAKGWNKVILEILESH